MVYQNVGRKPESTLNIVHICGEDIGGAGKAAYRLHKGLQAIGHNSTLLVLRKKSNDLSVQLISDEKEHHSTDKLEPSFQRWRELCITYPHRPQGLEIFSDTFSTVRFDRIKKIRDANVVNLHWVAGLLDYEHVAEVFTEKKIVWTLHDMNPFTGGCHYAGYCEKYTTECSACPQLGSNMPNDHAYTGWFEKINCLSKLDITVVTPSRWLGRCAVQSAIFHNRTVQVIPNSIPVNIYQPYNRLEIRRSLNIPEDAKVILFGADGVLNHRKGFSLLLKALELFHAPAEQEVILATFGSLSSSNKISSSYPLIHLGSYTEDHLIAHAYNLADLFVAPSLEDNLPNTILEAMACGVPVVGFNIGGIPDMIEHLKTGYLAPPGNVEGLNQGINWVLFEADSIEMSRHCRERVLAHYTQEIQAENYLSVYREG